LQDRLKTWLESIGLGKYVDAFVDNEIDFSVLPDLSEDDLVAIGLSLGARRKLQAAISQLQTNGDFGSSIPRQQDAGSGSAERRQLTVMFCDLAGSTELSQQLDPEELRVINLHYQRTCRSMIEQFGGFVARYMGDGVLAYFGYPQAHEDDAERAIHAALRIVSSLSESDDSEKLAGRQLAVRIGIATGPVVVGDVIGEGTSMESAVVGETPNLAARLQSVAAENSVVISALTRKLAAGHFDYEDLGKLELKGINQPTPAWRVVSESVSRSRFAARQQEIVSPLIGRDFETGLLQERWQDALDGDGQVVCLSGEPGIGKSRICEALVSQALDNRARIVRYQCSAFHLNTAYRPIVEQVRQDAAITAADEDTVKLSRIQQLTAALQESIPAATWLIANLLSIDVGEKLQQHGLDPDQVKDATIETLVSLITDQCRRQSTILFFEDAHWADPTTIEFLGALIDRVQSIPVLVILTHRLEFTPPWGEYSHITSLKLNRLSRARAIRLVAGYTSEGELPDAIVSQIVEKADGIPLYLEELVQTVIESRQVQDGPDKIEIPETLHDSLMARLDRSPAMREVAQTAAVIGREFSHMLIVAITDLPIEQLDEALLQLEDSALIFRQGAVPDSRYQFKHALVQEAAYESLLKSTRRKIHARIAQTLESDFPATIIQEPELLAHHFSEAGQIDAAARYWLAAGEKAIKQGAHIEAVAHLQQGLAIIGSMEDSEERAHREVDIRIALGIALVITQGGASAEVADNYLRARELCEHHGLNQQLYPVTWGLWFHHHMNTQLSSARELADRLLQLGGSDNDIDKTLEAYHCQWATAIHRGDISATWETSEKGISMYDAEAHHALTYTYGGHDPGVCARSANGLSLWLMGFSEKSKQRHQTAETLAHELDHSRTVANALRMDLLTRVLTRDHQAVGEKAEILGQLATTEPTIDRFNLAGGLGAWARYQDSRDPLELEVMAEVAEQWLAGSLYWTAPSVVLIAETLAESGNLTAGFDLVESAIGAVKPEVEHWWTIEAYRARARLLSLLDARNSKEIEADFETAIELARTHGAKSLELRAESNFVDYMQSHGNHAASVARLQLIYDWFTEGFDSHDHANARRVLQSSGNA
jgi:class 3 adenylate cyclase